KAIAFVDTFTEFLNAQNPDADSSVPKITVSTDGLIYGPGTITLDEGVIFNYHNDSGITLDPGKSITISFNTFKLLEGLTYLARTSNPLQKIILETSNDGVNFLESDTTFI